VKFLEDMLHKARPLFEKGGKFERLYPLYEAKETFLFVGPQRTSGGAHIRDSLDTKRLMTMVIIALLPCMFFGMYNVGYQAYQAIGDATNASNLMACVLKGAWHMMPIIVVSYAAGGVWEVVFAVTRKHEINEGFLVTGLLFPLTMPPTMPLWMVAVSVSFGVVIGKEVFGGTGMNIFNPALVARAFAFFAFPAYISGDKVWAVVKSGAAIEGYSGATPLLQAASHGTSAPVVEALNNFGGASHFADFSWLNMFLGRIPGSMGETSTLAILLGALFLIVTGVGSWRIMVSCIIGCLGMAAVFYFSASGSHPASIMALPPHYHLVMGGFAFGTVFMATDPVSAAGTNTGKWIYGFMIGAIAVIIRAINPAFPEGMMLSILFCNAFAPLIDHVVVQKHISRRMSRAQAV
jgi:Na+-transporting NADH:ubiquinone oxidoreductase subunit B